MEKKNKPDLTGHVGPQRRFAKFQFRMTEAEDKPLQIRGHGSVFGVLSEDLGGFREMIHPGAFDRALKDSDIRCLFNHDANLILGRNTSGTLDLGTDENGLTYDCDMADVTYARDLKVSIDRGDVTQSSFAFTVDWDDESGKKWDFTRSDTGEYILNHYDVEELFDVSPVTYPAYKAAGVRSALPALERAKEAFEARKDAKEDLEQEKADQAQAAHEETIKAKADYRARQIQINKNNNF